MARLALCAPLPFRLLQIVQFFQYRHGQHDLVIFKTLGSVRSLDQDIRIKYINLYHRVSPFRIVFIYSISFFSCFKIKIL